MTILSATDFSSCSRTAVRLAASLAKRRGEMLHLLHVVEPMGVDPAAAMIANAAWEAEMASTAEGELELIAQQIRATGVAVATSVVQGYAAGEILDAARVREVSLIVVGSHGRKGAARLVIGSCAQKVACAAVRPVLVARESSIDFRRWESSLPLRLALATDGSAATRAVFFWARSAAATTPENITLVRVYWPPQEGARYGIDDPWFENEGNPEILRLMERDLRHDAKALGGAQAPPIRFQVALRNGGEELAESAAGLGIDALVTGVPRRRLGHWTSLGPKAVLRAASMPVFCIPEGIEPAGRHIPRFRSVLIATDFSDVSKQAILPAYGLLAGGGQAHLCHVVEQKLAGEQLIPVAPALSAQERTALEEKLRALTPDEAAERGIGTHVTVLEGTSVATEILQAAERLDVDAIAIASHGRTGLGRLLIGSVAEEVVRRSSRPLLIVRGKAVQP